MSKKETKVLTMIIYVFIIETRKGGEYMFVVDNETIKNEMFIKRITGIEMAKKLDLSQTSFYKKINGKRDFTASEIGVIAGVLQKEINFFYKSCF